MGTGELKQSKIVEARWIEAGHETSWEPLMIVPQHISYERKNIGYSPQDLLDAVRVASLGLVKAMQIVVISPEQWPLHQWEDYLEPLELLPAAYLLDDSEVYEQGSIRTRLTTEGGSQLGWVNVAGNTDTPVLYFNKALAGNDLIYDLQAAGSWTWDAWMELMSGQSNYSGGLQDRWAIAYSQELLDSLVFSNGARYVSMDSNGAYHDETGSAAFLGALNMLSALKKGNMLLDVAGNKTEALRAFLSGKTVFYLGYVADTALIEKLGGMEWQGGSLAWGLSLFPMGPSSGSRYILRQDNEVKAIVGGHEAVYTNYILRNSYDVYKEAEGSRRSLDDNKLIQAQYENFWDFRAVEETYTRLLLTENYGDMSTVYDWSMFVKGYDKSIYR
jgi:hypothetical protein